MERFERFTNWLTTLPGATDPDDLRQETLSELLPIFYILSGVMFFRCFRLNGKELIASLLVAIFLLVGALLAFQLRKYNFRVAWSCLVVVIMGAVAFESWGFPNSPARYFYPAAIFAVSLLAFRRNIVFVSLVSMLLLMWVAVANGYSWRDLEQVVYPGLLILTLGTATWLTSRHLHRELRRSREGSVRVRDMLEEIRLQRVELDRTIKTLGFANERIENMNTELVEARNAAEDANRIKTEFLSHMSHELRTPLNAILNFTAFVADGLMGEVNDTQVDTLQKVMDSGNHLLSLINDILDISKIEAGMMNLFIEEVDLNTILKGTISTTKGLVKNKPVELVAEIDAGLPQIRGDKRRIRQVFLNLVSNAVKFTPEGSITIRANQRNGDIFIAVEDTGIGISAEDLDNVFVAFKQAQHDLRNVAGTGLGLPISKHFVEAHGGSLWLESELGLGSTFYVTLPLESDIESGEIEV